MTEFKEYKLKTEEGTLFQVQANNGEVGMLIRDGSITQAFLLTSSEVGELCASLRMALEEAQAALSTGPEFEHDEYLRVVALSAHAAKLFLGRNDEPVDLGPADVSRYRVGARVWGFKGKP
jgi:hypothetical protein